MAKSALIVGPPRSGTSLASSILARAGYHVGSIGYVRKRVGDDHNPFGYFEADRVVEANAVVLRRAGYPFHNTWTFRPEIDKAAERRIGELEPSDEDRLLLDDYEPHAPWLWKDPRLCFTLPYWSKLVDWSRTVVYLTTRDLADAYPSFRRKEWCGWSLSERRRVRALVRRHTEAARRAVENLALPFVSIDYGDYAADPAGVAARLSEVFEIEVAPADLNFHPELDHSGLRGTVAAEVRRQLKRLPRKPVERLASLVPRRLLGLLFPERLHVHGSPGATPSAEGTSPGTDGASVRGWQPPKA
ncbi:MAG TPA: sulfotransferase [Longimicrobiales bacterium]|nr:sulfotransferase [Longimicrobiales bacterium]